MEEATDLYIGSEYEHETHGHVVLVGITTEGTEGHVLAEVDDGDGIPVLMDSATSYAYFDEHADASLEDAKWKETLSSFVRALNG